MIKRVALRSSQAKSRYIADYDKIVKIIDKHLRKYKISGLTALQALGKDSVPQIRANKKKINKLDFGIFPFIDVFYNSKDGKLSKGQLKEINELFGKMFLEIKASIPKEAIFDISPTSPNVRFDKFKDLFVSPLHDFHAEEGWYNLIFSFEILFPEY